MIEPKPETLRRGMAAEPERRITEPEMLPEVELHAAEEGNAMEVAHPRDACVHELFERQVKRTPDAVAVVFEGEHVTYAELNRRANRLAHHLRELGVRPEVLVGLCLDRSLELVVSLLGVLKAGGAYVPLDPSYPSERLRHMVADSGMELLLTREKFRATLPTSAGARVVILEAAERAITVQPMENPASGVTPEHLAYVIYTSGSTGQPKGSLVPHRSIPGYADVYLELPQGSPPETWLQYSSLSWDALTLELWTPLLRGSRCVLYASAAEAGVTPQGLARAIAEQGVTTLWMTSTLFNTMLDVAPEALQPLRVLLVGGEQLSGPHVRRARALLPGTRLVNGYGPSECTVFIACHVIPGEPEELPAGTIPLGRPVGDRRCYVLDSMLELAPVGVAGELCVGGPAVARGYLGRPELTAGRFVPDPYASEGGARLYRTGDEVRWRPDGTLEYVGRLDEQVKVRGYRIELGEIEARLLEHGAVREAVVVAREDDAGDKRLVAYWVEKLDSRVTEASDESESDHVAAWKDLYDSVYGENGGDSDPTFNIGGWNSSYTGQPIPPEEMREWLDATVARTVALKPKRVLEIGCGSGLILFRLAAGCERYVGTDFSADGLRKVRAVLDGRPEGDRVELYERLADDFSGFAPGSFDLVVINSVVQYLPSIHYLETVIERAVRAVAPGGHVFVGDVRNLDLLGAFHTAVETYRSAPTTPVAEWRARAERAQRSEDELVIAPAFFRSLRQRLASVDHVEVLHKRGRFLNEMTEFRYDVVLYVGAGDQADPEAEADASWEIDRLTLDSLRARLQETTDELLIVADVPNARVSGPLKLLAMRRDSGSAETVEDVRRLAFPDGVNPEELWTLGESLGWSVEVSVADSDNAGRVDAMFSRRHGTSGRYRFPALRGWTRESLTACATAPMRSKPAGVLPSHLRSFLEARLPAYMLPAAYVRLEALPLTPNGKVDRRGLPAPARDAYADATYEAPVGEAEAALAQIWAEVLRMERVGRWDHFFELGGHSLLAVQVVSRVRQRLGVEVALGEVFRLPVLAEFARAVAGAARADLPRIEPVDRAAPLPLSFAQQRLWFLEQLGGMGNAFHILWRLRLQGRLDGGALGRALERIVARHEVLRTTFTLVDGEPVQRIALVEESRFHLAEHDLRGEAGAEEEVGRLLAQEWSTPFDLERGPLIRGCLIRLGEDDHVLQMTMHHIVSDGWSMGVLTGELSTLYAACLRGEADPLPAPAVQYGDYAVWQRRWLTGEVLREQAEYWRRRLAGATELLELPTDHPRPARMGHAGASLDVELGEELTGRLKELSRRQGTTLFMTLLTGWAVVLSRLSGQEDLVVGTPTANRGRAEIEGLIGFFVNTLALRLDLSGAPRAGELMERVRERALEAQHHQDIPFEQVVELAQPMRSLSHSPLFQVMFAWQNAPGGELVLPGVEVAAMGEGAEQASTQFDLSLSLGESGGRIVGGVQYATSLYERGTVDRYLGYLRRVLEAMAAGPQRRITEIEMLTEAERRLVVVEWNATEAAYPRDVCVHELFEREVERSPDAVAVVYESEVLSYAELNRRANRLAHHLRDLGVGPDTRVAICAEPSLEMMVGVLGVLKAGGAYVPLDPSYPEERLGYMLRDSAPAVLLRQPSLASRFVEMDLPALDLCGQEPAWASAPETNPARERVGLTPEHLAYVIYTSGSTGRPKGVMVEHRGVCNLALAQIHCFAVEPGSRVLQFGSFSFDACVSEVAMALCRGASLHLTPRGVTPAGEALVEIVAAHGITHLTLPPAVLATLPGDSELRPVRTMVVAGDVMPETAARRWAKGRRLVNAYGPTEATVCASVHVCGADEAGKPSIGRPLSNAQIYILDGAGEPVPVNVAGELYIGGAGVARGYLGRAELTAERFVPDPFGKEDGGRLYRTGDLGLWSPGGTIAFLGRNDHQVKLRGYRIELGEIEALLVQHPGVREAALAAREDTPGNRRVVAYWVGSDEVGVERLRAHLLERLPEYMVPAAYVRLERLPLNPNGKLDRRALPAPEGDAYARRGYEAPVGEIEAVLAQIWAEVLKMERVGRRDHFFDLGGHSLLAVQVASRVRQRLGVEVALGEVFRLPTLAEFARAVEGATRADLPRIEPVDRAAPLPLSFAQQQLWFLDRLEPGSSTYNIPVAWRLGGALDEPALERALGEIVRRHEALRTTFADRDGSPVQVIARFGGFALPVEDLSDLSEADREAEVRRRAGKEARRPFDLAAGPLFRAALLRVADEDHVLLLCIHHIVTDGWSMGVLFRELSALYEAYREGRESPLAELAVQYADYAVWQREQLAGEVLDRQLAYWRERLADAPAVLELPTDHPRPAVQTYRGATVPVEFSPELLERLQRLGRSEGATLYMVLLGAFQVLLGKYAGSEDVVVGSPIAGRTRGEIEELIGFFVNTLVLRTDLSGDPSFRETLRRVREATLGAYAHQDVPFEKLVAELQPERSLSHSPLFQVMFTLQNAGGRESALPGLKVSGAGAELASAKFDLSVEFAETPEGLRGGLNYSTDLFERGTVERMLGHLERVLEQVAANADVRLSQLELLGEAERALVLEEWNRTEAEYPADRCIHERFEAQAARTPGAVAVRFEEESLTLRELNAHANQLAHHLRRRGVGPEVRVGICLERSLEMVVAILAILKAGGAYVPLDPGYPAERLAFILADSATPVLLTRETLRGAIPAREGVEVVSLDGAAKEIAAESLENPQSGAGPDSLAYVIYTSGSTGTPKGALIEHRNVARLFSATDAWFGFGPDDVWTLFHSYAFDFSVWELWGALLYGGRVVVVPFDVSRDPEAFHALVQREGVTVLSQTPSAFRQFIRVDGERGGDLALRNVIFGGEALEPASLREWVERRGADTPRLVNMYGITETTVHVTYRPLSREDVFGGSGSPIGRAIPDLRLYVLDPARRPMPVGVPGELYVGGAGVARGYLNRPELTAERFVDDPFTPGRLYRTGDRVRWMADGTLEYLGRLDEQVKIRGFRIELGEIEAALRQAPGVADCTVIVRDDETGDRRLVAYVVGEAEAEALRDRLRQSLPEYMVPSAFVALDARPLTSNGKLDRKALPAPELASAEERYVAPRTPVEEVLAGIWTEVLRLERVGVTDNFFELGGHSLLATRVISRIRAVFGVELPLRALFEGPTIAEMAVRVEEIRRADLPVLPPVVPVERTGALPLSFAQERLWFIDQLEPGSAVYNIPMAWRLGGALDRAALERALGEIVRRHEALRTTFKEVEGSPVQVVAPFGGFALPVEDLSGLSGADREEAVRRRVGGEARRAFDLAAEPLFRAVLLRVDEEDHVLLLAMHHIVSDGWSMEVFFRELSALYAAYRAGRESPLPELAVQYADYAVWQREQLAGEALDRQLSYWRERLGGAPELLELPTDHPRPPVQTYRGESVGVNFSPELLERLQALGRSEGATLYMVLLGAFQVLLSRYGGCEDVVVGSPIAGRTREEVEELIGFFINTLVLRTDLSGDPSFREVLRRVREVTLGAYEHQDVPFEKLVAELQPERSLSHSPLFQAIFALQNAGDLGGELLGLKVGGVGAAMGIAKYDLSLTLGATAQGLRGGLNYSTDLFERGTVERMLGHLERVLEQVAADADVRLSQLDLLGGAERALVLEEWNRTGAEYPADRCIHELFEAQAARTPGAVALRFEEESLTYAELNERANRLAHCIRGLGVGPDVRVGVCVERSLEMVVSLLAVLKAGGAYVPLDPGLPAERLAYMLDDSAVPLVLVQAALRETVPAREGVGVLAVDALAERLAAEPAENPAGGAGPDSLAYVIYTSGSTGRPKGVMNVHRGVVNLLWSMRGTVAMAPADRLLAVTTFAFNISVLELFFPLLSGARVEILDRFAASDPVLLREAVGAGVGTVLQATPATWRLLLDAGWEGAESLRALSGGEALPAELAARLRERVGALWNVYGPTETTIWSTAQPLGAGTDVGRGHVSIGAPVANTRVYVVDRYLSPEPAGVPGELYIGGAGVARGYLGRPGLSAEKFVPDPFAAEPGARLYRTGDRARWRADGTLEFLGRKDHQVKVRGFRIELGEIEAALRQAPGVADCAVVAREDETGDRRLVAYVVGEAETAALRAHLRGSLPEYMVPQAIVALDRLPLNANGKLDRKALPAPELASAEEKYVAPRTPVEEVLAGIWTEVLRLERVGVHDSFFDLGGHSLLIMRLLAKIQATFDLDISIRTVFSMPTLEAMAGEIERRIYEDAVTMSEFEAEQLARSNPVAGV